MINPPMRSPREKVGGICYFGRMIDKIRLHLEDALPEEYNANFGQIRSLDGWLSGFLNLTHRAVVDRVRQGGTDEEILEWCFVQGFRPNETQIHIWNRFAEKLGWRDSAGATVARVKQAVGPAAAGVETIFDCLESDEHRPVTDRA
jgi:gluconokinase